MQKALKKELKLHGIRCSDAKILVLDLIKQQKTAFRTADLIEKLETKVDKVTVYRALNQFYEKGLIKEILNTKKGRYFEQKGSSHGHFYCISCQKIECLKTPDLSLSLKNKEITEVSLSVCGFCENCLKEKNEKTTNSTSS